VLLLERLLFGLCYFHSLGDAAGASNDARRVYEEALLTERIKKFAIMTND
jgi:hypothetical protein